MVKVDPWPASLSTLISPPIISQKRREIVKPQAGPAVPSSGRRVGLDERAEQSGKLLDGHADAVVSHLEDDPLPAFEVELTRAPERDRPPSVNLMALLKRLSRA